MACRVSPDRISAPGELNLTYWDKWLDVPAAGLLFKILKIRQKLRQIQDAIGMDEARLGEYRLEQLKSVMAHAWSQIPLYREKWRAAGLRPEDVQSLDDLAKFPILSKEELRNAPPAATGLSRDRHYVFKTTGSSGSPISIAYDRDKGFYEIALISTFSINLHFQLRLKKGMSILVLDDEAMEILPAIEFPRFKKFLFDALEPVENQIAHINRVRPDYLVTYPSVLKNIALRVQAEQIKIHQPALLMTTGESHDDHTRKIIGQTFAGELIDGYAATETGVIAVECPRHNGLHVLDYRAIVEIVDDEGRPAPPGQSGNVVVTDLVNRAFPLIRYSGMGDIAGYRPGRCTCGLRALPLLDRIEGRKIDSILLPDNRIVHPYRLTLLVQDLPGVQKFQIRQETQDEILVLIVRDPAGAREASSAEDLPPYRELKKRLQDVLGGGMTVRLRFVDDIPRSENSHKYQTVVSLVHSRGRFLSAGGTAA